MHLFSELIDLCTTTTLESLATASRQAIRELARTQGATVAIRATQMIQLQKAILAVGMFSLFEASVQDELQVTNGLREATSILEREGEMEVLERFRSMCLAINVLKHGRGRSYDALVERASALPFRIKLPGQDYFLEGDVSEPRTLLLVDDAFVEICASVVREVSEIVHRVSVARRGRVR